MSVAGQWDTVNGEVLRCPAVQASMDHDHQLECHTISDVKPVELLMEQLRQSTIKLANVAGDARQH